MSSEFTIGQRWISNTESDLGLGIIKEVSGRLITIAFPATEEERTYASNNAPISRISYRIGDTISTLEGDSYEVEALKDDDGYIFYQAKDAQGESHIIGEIELDSAVVLASPDQKLCSGQLDKTNAYQLRVNTLFHADEQKKSPLRGLLGSRTSLLPHQLYIANSVASRHAPRVLLADEVGLGKTIEAGMIIHQQLLTGRASRVLVLVPDTLIHQWLVEMLRRFNLHFAIYSQDRIDALKETGETEFFDAAQLVIAPLSLLKDDENLDAALQSHWDLLVVDEAHHLVWDEELPSLEYDIVEALSSVAAGLLLLTATPEQAGIESHFARLRLLDPARFSSLEAFTQEQNQYAEVSDWVELLGSEKPLGITDLAQINELTGQSLLEADIDADKRQLLIGQMLDMHGTGRILYRNTRRAIDAFPERHIHRYELTPPADYDLSSLTPESDYDNDAWLKNDPRVDWLIDLLKSLRPAKVLVICANANTAIDLEHHLHLRAGIRSTSFHEGLSIIERDSAAAYFADTEGGAQVMVCSEIGSEGRNFQFASNLVLFDLPLNPDLLEQRIGRLDRIGQANAIDIHAPVFTDAASAFMFDWYNQGLNLFEKSFSAGFSIYQQLQERMTNALQNPSGDHSELLATTAKLHEQTRQAQEAGRDPLLELNSCRPQEAAALVAAIEAQENDDSLEQYLPLLLDTFGVDSEEHSEHTQIWRPSEHMLTEHFPGLKEEGITLTLNRDKALIREDMTFASWEHPIIEEAIDMVLSGDIGCANLTSLPIKGLEPGTLLLEAYYTASCLAPKSSGVERYIALAPQRIFCDIKGRDLSKVMTFEQLNARCVTLKKTTALQVVRQMRGQVENVMDVIKKRAEQVLPQIISDASAQMQSALSEEISRLEWLKLRNPAIRKAEIDHLKTQQKQGMAYLASTTLQLQAVRAVITVSS